ncbi:hypothetical protein KP509_37G005000 [Ceratopteris richardii]|uniref:Uncharacterized protein n=1 Tax=Ceratopteris richardii TaxID=49495 RepID=A0A8T2Q638_CERRI|nr:hypothetical protein KP509_37G005000 [Ceratopteris richardii]
MAFVLRRIFVAPLLIINFTLYFIIAAVAGWALDTAIDQGWEAVSYDPATYYFVLFSLLAGVLGLGSKFSAAHHLTTWHHHSLASSSSVSYVSWLVTVLAMGLALKQISLGGFLRGEVNTFSQNSIPMSALLDVFPLVAWCLLQFRPIPNHHLIIT